MSRRVAVSSVVGLYGPTETATLYRSSPSRYFVQTSEKTVLRWHSRRISRTSPRALSALPAKAQTPPAITFHVTRIQRISFVLKDISSAGDLVMAETMSGYWARLRQNQRSERRRGARTAALWPGQQQCSELHEGGCDLWCRSANGVARSVALGVGEWPLSRCYKTRQPICL
jgi:hypothetical protein